VRSLLIAVCITLCAGPVSADLSRIVGAVEQAILAESDSASAQRAPAGTRKARLELERAKLQQAELRAELIRAWSECRLSALGEGIASCE
jgi:hypothetical protein